MMNVLLWLLVFAAIILLGGTILSFVVVRRQRYHETDRGLNQTTAKHRILANPILIAYVLFPLAIVIGVLILFYLL